jgi:hypothetical protein
MKKAASPDTTKVKDAKMSYVVTMGQAFDSKRMETFDTMQQVVQSAPTLFPMFGDVLFQAIRIWPVPIILARAVQEDASAEPAGQRGSGAYPATGSGADSAASQHLQAINAACKRV